MAKAYLRVTDLAVGKILDGVAFEVEAGSILGIVGPSGCGKSTLIQAIAGVLPVTRGAIEFNNTALTHLSLSARPTGTVFQDTTVFPGRTVRENVAFGLDDSQMGDRHRDDLVDLTLAQLGILELGDARVEYLSGGQAQRVALARTLVRRPSIFLLDEPLVHVDPTQRASIQHDIVRQVRRSNLATVYVTHDIDEACRVSDTIAVMDQGRIVQHGSPQQLYREPSSVFVARIMGIPNIFEGEIPRPSSSGVVRARVGGVDVDLHINNDVVAGRATFIFPPEAVRLRSASSTGLRGVIIHSVFVRTHMEYEIETPIGTLVSVGETHDVFAVGENVSVEPTYTWTLQESIF